MNATLDELKSTTSPSPLHHGHNNPDLTERFVLVTSHFVKKKDSECELVSDTLN